MLLAKYKLNKMLKIRTYQNSDYKLVWDLYIEGLNTANINVGDGNWNDDLRQIEETYLNNSGDFLIGLIDDKIIAMGAIRKLNKKCAEVKRMRVKSEFARQGFGQTILTSLERRAKELGYSQLQLDTSTLQEAAQKFYIKNGYEETNRSIVHFGKRKFEVIYYSKSI